MHSNPARRVMARWLAGVFPDDTMRIGKKFEGGFALILSSSCRLIFLGQTSR